MYTEIHHASAGEHGGGGRSEHRHTPGGGDGGTGGARLRLRGGASHLAKETAKAGARQSEVHGNMEHCLEIVDSSGCFGCWSLNSGSIQLERCRESWLTLKADPSFLQLLIFFLLLFLPFIFTFNTRLCVSRVLVPFGGLECTRHLITHTRARTQTTDMPHSYQCYPESSPSTANEAQTDNYTGSVPHCFVM